MSERHPDNQGEGNTAAAMEYNERTQKFVDEGKVEESARTAADAIDSAEGAELREAERRGRMHAHEEDPQVKRDR